MIKAPHRSIRLITIRVNEKWRTRYDLTPRSYCNPHDLSKLSNWVLTNTHRLPVCSFDPLFCSTRPFLSFSLQYLGKVNQCFLSRTCHFGPTTTSAPVGFLIRKSPPSARYLPFTNLDTSLQPLQSNSFRDSRQPSRVNLSCRPSF